MIPEQPIQPRPRRSALRRILAALAAVPALMAATALAVALHAVWLVRHAAVPAPAAAIVVLGGGVRGDGTPGPDTLARVERGIALWAEGVAPRLHFTGGHGNPAVTGLGDAMATVARAAGVPAGAITSESASNSTLQNALLSRAALPPEAGSVVLVSDGYHLARAWASFRWAGYRPVAVSAASAFGPEPWERQLRRVVRETLAWWYNVPRAALWSLLQALGLDPSPSMELLARDSGARRAA